MALEAAALRPAVAEDLTEPMEGPASANEDGPSDGIGKDYVHTRDLRAFEAGIVEPFASRITDALKGSYILRTAISLASNRFARHLEHKRHLALNDRIVGVLLQEIFLKVRATLSDQPVAHYSENYMALEGPERAMVTGIVAKAADLISKVLQIGIATEKAWDLNEQFCRVLEENDLRATESLVGDLLQAIWLRVHAEFNK